MGTCHKCAAPLGRGTQKHTQCPKCGLLYHVTDCGGRYASCPEIDTPLEDCPKVRRESFNPSGLTTGGSTARVNDPKAKTNLRSAFHESVRLALFRNSCPREKFWPNAIDLKNSKEAFLARNGARPHS